MPSGYFVLEQGLDRPTDRDLDMAGHGRWGPYDSDVSGFVVYIPSHLESSWVRDPHLKTKSLPHRPELRCGIFVYDLAERAVSSEYFSAAKLSSIEGCKLWKCFPLIIVGSDMSTESGTGKSFLLPPLHPQSP